jgi:hypothetical protein
VFVTDIPLTVTGVTIDLTNRINYYNIPVNTKKGSDQYKYNNGSSILLAVVFQLFGGS